MLYLCYMKCLNVTLQKLLHAALLLFVAFLIASTIPFQILTAHASANDKIHYQGKLYDSGGSPVTDGSHTMVFKFYAAATGGTALWTETQTVSTTGGLFTALLGSVTSLSGINWNQALYLGVTVDSDSEMTPRHTVGAVPTAHTLAGSLRLDSTLDSYLSGKLGIGTTSPAYPLDVYLGTANAMRLKSDDVYSLVVFEDDTTTPGQVAAGASGNDFQIFTGGTVRLTVASSTGNVGIGVSAPTSRLHTTGTVRFAGFGAGTLTTDASGNLSVSSDERLKDITGSFETGLAAIRGLEPIRYRWNATSGLETESIYAGFSAQNVMDHIEDAVGVDTNTGYFTLSDRPIIAASVNAIKELDLTIESLASTTAATSTEDGTQTFVGRFLDRMIAWFADTANGIGNFFAKSFRAEETICVGAVCIGEAELEALLQNAGITSSSDTYTSDAVVITTSGAEESAEGAGDTATGADSVATTTDEVATGADGTATTTQEAAAGAETAAGDTEVVAEEGTDTEAGTGTPDTSVGEESADTPVAEDTVTEDASTASGSAPEEPVEAAPQDPAPASGEVIIP